MGKSNLVYNITNLSFSYGKNNEGFQNINLEIDAGEKIAIIGPNGSGKSTLLNLLAGSMNADAGAIELLGSNLLERTHRERAQLFTYLPQFGKNSSIELRVFEFVEMGLFSEQGRFEYLAPNQKTRIREALDLFELGPFAERPITTLSGGEYQRARLARSFVRAPNIYLLDEPSAALDVKFQLKLWEQIRLFDAETVIAAIHDIDVATRIFDRVLVLNKRGELIADTIDMTTDILEFAFEVSVKKMEFDETTHWLFKR